ncbi:conserved hypothetical protein [Candidatus Liberibacter solanacearum]
MWYKRRRFFVIKNWCHFWFSISLTGLYNLNREIILESKRIKCQFYRIIEGNIFYLT